MLGEGIVSLAVEPFTVSRRNSKASPKIVLPSPTRYDTRMAGGA